MNQNECVFYAIASAAGQNILAYATFNPVIARTTINNVIAGAAIDCVIARTTFNCVIAGAAIDCVTAAEVLFDLDLLSSLA